MHGPGERRIYTGEPTELVCQCLKVARQSIKELIVSDQVETVAQIRRACKAGGGCGACHEELARMLLVHRFKRPLNFDHNAHDEIINNQMIDTGLHAELYQFVDDHLNPDLQAYQATAQIIEMNEEVVIELKGLAPELKYTLSFWLDAEFHQHYPDLTLIIA